MNNFINAMYIKALVAAGQVRNEFQKLREEDEGLDIIVTIVLVAAGLVLVGLVAKFAADALKKTNSQMETTFSGFGSLNYK